jgi:hypothetical protein
MTMSSNKKALNTGRMEAVRAPMMVLKDLRRPKRRMTRTARVMRRTLAGRSSGPRDARERLMTTMSMRLYWLRKKGANQCA